MRYLHVAQVTLFEIDDACRMSGVPHQDRKRAIIFPERNRPAVGRR